MAQTDALKKYLDAGMAFTQLTRSKAEQVVKELVSAGELQKNQAKGAIDELVERSRRNAELLAEQVRKEVDAQLANMGLARKADVERLEDELSRLKGSGGSPAAEGGADDQRPKKAPAKKAPAKKAGKASADEAGSSSGEAAAAEGSGGDEGTPVKKTAKKTGGGESGVSAQPPARPAGGSDGDPAGAKPEAAKKAPAKKTAKKASGGSQAGVGAELPGRRPDESSGSRDEPEPAKKPAKATKKQG